MTLDEVKELIELVATKGFAEFEIARNDFKLKIVATVAPTPAREVSHVATVTPASAASVSTPATTEAATLAPVPETPVAAEEDLFVVASPIVGTFYRSASPTAEVFVKVGDRVEVGGILCIVEAMKLMNEIESERAGEIVKIFVENGQPVEYGQPLFGLRT